MNSDIDRFVERIDTAIKFRRTQPIFLTQEQYDAYRKRKGLTVPVPNLSTERVTKLVNTPIFLSRSERNSTPIIEGW